MKGKVRWLLLALVLGLLTAGSGAARAAEEEGMHAVQQRAPTFRFNFQGSWTPAEQQAARQAGAIWETVMWSSVPLDVQVSLYDNFHSVMTAGAGSYVSRWSYNPDVTYPIALYNAILDLDGNGNEITIALNRSEAWYAGTDGQTPADQYDLLTAVLKGIGIGLGLESRARADCQPWSGQPGGCWGLPNTYTHPLVYEALIVNGQGQRLTNTALFPNPSLALQAQLTGNDLYFGGAQATAANGGSPPKLYAPAAWPDQHDTLLLDEQAYPRGSANALMTDRFEKGEAIHAPGPIAAAMLYDMGWSKPKAPPVLRPLPSMMMLPATSRSGPDLWDYVSDVDTPVDQISFDVTVSPSTTSFVVQRPDGHSFYITAPGNVGTVSITVDAVDPDGLHSGEQTFYVYAVAALHEVFLPIARRP